MSDKKRKSVANEDSDSSLSSLEVLLIYFVFHLMMLGRAPKETVEVIKLRC